MALKKSALYSSLWKSCDELRGGMDASQYKDYVLTLLFVKYVSDKYAGKRDALIQVPEGGSFADMVALKGKADIGEKINVIIGKLAEAIHKIVDVFTKQLEVPKYSRMVPVAEIASAANDYNLNIPRYIDSSEAEDIHDIAAHLKGGIPARDIEVLSSYWRVFPSLRATLFAESDRPGYFSPQITASEVKPTIFHHPEFTAYAATVRTVFAEWKAAQTPVLKTLAPGSSPKVVIHAASEDLLTRFGNISLLDKYDVYQQLMDYWAETMQDDVFAIASDGWVAGSDLIPASLVIARYFANEQKAIETAEAEAEEFARQMEEIEEEHGGEDGLLEEAKNEKGKLTKASIKTRLRDIDCAGEERRLLQTLDGLIEKEAAANKKAKEASKVLEKRVVEKYKSLTEAEIMTLVVDDKWMATLEHKIMSEMERVTQSLASRIKLLEERYSTPLPKLEQSVAEYREKVGTHLKKMGFAW